MPDSNNPRVDNPSRSSLLVKAFLLVGLVVITVAIVSSCTAPIGPAPTSTTVGPELNITEPSPINYPQSDPPLPSRTRIPETTVTPKQTTVIPIMPTAIPGWSPAKIGPSPSSAELQATLDTASAIGDARLTSMQAAYRTWAVPSHPDLVSSATNVRMAGLKSDGVTDNTGVLQSLLDSLPTGSQLYFPAGTYRIDGPVYLINPVTLVGESGTVFDCRKSALDVFTVNKAGSISSKISDVTITGITFEGPGVGTSPVIIYGFYLQNFRVTHTKFHNVGRAAIGVLTSTDVLIEDCVFDNVFMEGEGYGVSIADRSDRVVVRDSFFVTKGRHGIATGTATSDLTSTDYVQSVTVENNYFEYMTEEAVNAHNQNTGPFIIRGNVMYLCAKGVQLGNGISEVTDNVIKKCDSGILLWNNNVDAAQLSSKIDTIARNTILDTVYEAIYVTKTNVKIQDNVAKGANRGSAITLGSYSPTSCTVSGNVADSFIRGLEITRPCPGISSTNNYLKFFGIFVPF